MYVSPSWLKSSRLEHKSLMGYSKGGPLDRAAILLSSLPPRGSQRLTPLRWAARALRRFIAGLLLLLRAVHSLLFRLSAALGDAEFSWEQYLQPPVQRRAEVSTARLEREVPEARRRAPSREG